MKQIRVSSSFLRLRRLEKFILQSFILHLAGALEFYSHVYATLQLKSF